MKSTIRIIIFVASLLAVIAGILHTRNGKIAGVNTRYEDEHVQGIILPHHNLAAELIDQSLDELKKSNDYQTIVIMSPNHFYPDVQMITSANKIDGLTIDSEAVNNITSDFDEALVNNEVISNEHGITVPASYVNKYFPQAKIIPLSFSRHYTKEQINQFTQVAIDNSNGKTLYILAIDFAHDVHPQEGLNNNEVSINALSGFNIDEILQFDDNYLDSPVAASVFLKIMQSLKADNFELWHSIHAASIVNDPTSLGTSYVVGVYK